MCIWSWVHSRSHKSVDFVPFSCARQTLGANIYVCLAEAWLVIVLYCMSLLNDKLPEEHDWADNCNSEQFKHSVWVWVQHGQTQHVVWYACWSLYCDTLSDGLNEQWHSLSLLLSKFNQLYVSYQQGSSTFPCVSHVGYRIVGAMKAAVNEPGQKKA